MITNKDLLEIKLGIKKILLDARTTERSTPLVEGKRYEKGYRLGVVNGIIQVMDYLIQKGVVDNDEENKKNNITKSNSRKKK